MASRSPNGHWVIDKNPFKGFNPNIPKFEHKVEVIFPSLENK